MLKGIDTPNSLLLATENMLSNASIVWQIPERGIAENAVVGTLMAVIIVMAVVGNVAVIVAVVTTPHLQKELSNIFIINLCITDLASAIFVMVSALIAICANDWPFGQAWCDVVCLTNYCFIIVSMLTLCFISVDRYIAIVRPLHYNIQMTKTRAITVISYCWLQVFTFAVIPVAFRWVRYDYWEGVCAIQWHQQRHKSLVYVISAVILCFSLPGFILVLCYGRVLQTTRQKRHIVAPADIKVRDQRVKYSTSSKAIYSLLVVMLAFFVCMTLFSVTKLYKVSVNRDDVLQNYVSLVASVVAYMSSAVNPLIYGIFRKDFRSAFKMMFRRLLLPRN